MKHPNILITYLAILLLGACTDGFVERRHGQARQALVDLTIDNADAQAGVVSGSFSNATAATSHWGPMSLYATTGGSVDTFRFTPAALPASTYTVYAWNSCYADRATDVPHRVFDGASTTHVVAVDQSGGGSCAEWFPLGTWSMGPGAYVEITDAGITSSRPYFGASGGAAAAGGSGGSPSGGGGGATGSSTGSSGGGSGASGGAGGAGGGSSQGGSGGGSSWVPFEPFNGQTLAPPWTVVNQSQFAMSLGYGRLEISVNSSCATWPYCAWFEATDGPGVLQAISGDFAITTLVRPRSATSPSAPPNGGYQLAGLVVRDPTTQTQNIVLNASGYRGAYLSNETKNTTDDNSWITGPAYPDQSTADRELRICRLGQVFVMLGREVGATGWNVSNTFDRTATPFSATAEAGVIAYTYSSPSNLVASFDYVRVDAPSAVWCGP
jgi:hypothetical protein